MFSAATSPSRRLHLRLRLSLASPAPPPLLLLAAAVPYRRPLAPLHLRRRRSLADASAPPRSLLPPPAPSPPLHSPLPWPQVSSPPPGYPWPDARTRVSHLRCSSLVLLVLLDLEKKATMSGDAARAAWNSTYEKGLVEILHEYKDNPKYKDQNGWVLEGWKIITTKFNERFSIAHFTKQQIQEKEKELKASYKAIRDAKAASGSGWNESLCMLILEPHV
ncbi:hypothetical protein HU200_003737 [Digitaria exilis]|uniref:Myb/SANT-like domain-containing protein n=1 Tax=Digitaria exilis TaxID=1010633 RepID=A0A835KUE3_9POAL|nr:hypothetical protein HU200_003737 [Digitaria exilis]